MSLNLAAKRTGFIVFSEWYANAASISYWDDLLKRIQKGEIDPLKMVTHRVKVEDLDKVYYKFKNKE